MDQRRARTEGGLVDGLLGGQVDERLGDVGVLGLGEEGDGRLLALLEARRGGIDAVRDINADPSVAAEAQRMVADSGGLYSAEEIALGWPNVKLSGWKKPRPPPGMSAAEKRSTRARFTLVRKCPSATQTVSTATGKTRRWSGHCCALSWPACLRWRPSCLGRC